MGGMTRWSPDARGRLQQAAYELFLERGYEQTTVADIASRAGLTERGFAHGSAATMRTSLLEAGLSNWESFAESWNDLGVDSYMADGGRYRRRRYAAYSVGAEEIRRKPQSQSSCAQTHRGWSASESSG